MGGLAKTLRGRVVTCVWFSSIFICENSEFGDSLLPAIYGFILHESWGYFYLDARGRKLKYIRRAIARLIFSY